MPTNQVEPHPAVVSPPYLTLQDVFWAKYTSEWPVRFAQGRVAGGLQLENVLSSRTCCCIKHTRRPLCPPPIPSLTLLLSFHHLFPPCPHSDNKHYFCFLFSVCDSVRKPRETLMDCLEGGEQTLCGWVVRKPGRKELLTGQVISPMPDISSLSLVEDVFAGGLVPGM